MADSEIVTDKNIQIDINWLITLSNKIDYYLEQNNKLNIQLNKANEELNNLKIIYIYNMNEIKNIIDLIKQNLNLNNTIKTDINTINAKLNDNILNISYIDDKIQEMSQNIININEQITQLQENDTNNFSSRSNLIL